jgi:hypothetical protein
MKRLFFILILITLLTACDDVNYETIETTYTVVEKETREEYNWIKSEFWGKAYYDNEYYLILEDAEGEITTENVSQEDYYSYEIGDEFIITKEVIVE